MKPTHLLTSLLLPLLAIGGGTLASTASAQQPVAVGKVQWGRELDAALATSRTSGKPVFLLFQEVPGCAGCQAFGRDVLSDEKVVHAIQANFVPLLIPNNQGGKDAEVLHRFREPAQNYQVVRFLDADAKDLIPRKEGVWTTRALGTRMVEALSAANRPVPGELKTFVAAINGPASPHPAAPTERVAFTQYCFWSGEMRLGQIPGVVRTEAGFVAGHEATLVDYDPAQVSLGSLVQQAERARCADAVYVTSPEQARLAAQAHVSRVLDLGNHYRRAPASDQKKQIQGTAAEGWNLTPEQATKVNAWIRTEPSRALGVLTSPPTAQVTTAGQPGSKR